MASCPECGAVYGDEIRTCPEHGVALVSDQALPAVDSGLAPGTMVGEYVIGRKLGAGSFGEVYAGEHPLIGKKVAVKVLNRQLASDPETVSRFIAEARLVNKIRQRNIIDIFAFGKLEGQDRHYFVMELCDGMTLGALLAQKGRLPVPTVLAILPGIAAALDAVHEAGITHRDLKPDNVFLATERDGSFFPKLLDFGIAKLMGDDPAHRTSAGVTIGTPRYMSPEQARGKGVDHRSDIYALGVMIHEMLTGAALFSADSAVDVLLKHTSEPPPPMSSVFADLPAELDAPVLAMLAKRPKDRPETAGQAVAAFGDCARRLGLDQAGAPARPTAPPPTKRWDDEALMATAPALHSAPPAPGPERGQQRWRWGLMAVLTLAGAATIWALGRSSSRPPDLVAPNPAPAAVAEAVPTATPVTAAPAALPTTITLRLSTRPPDVEVWLGHTRIGSSGGPLAVPRGSDRVALRLTKPNFKDERLELTPDRDQSLDATLSPLAASARPPGKSAAGQDPIEKMLGGRD